MPHWTALITVAALLVYLYSGWRVGGARRKFGVALPATTGNPDFERVFRAQMNTLEWLPIFLPLLWLFAFYIGDRSAAVLGLCWVVGRVLYINGYSTAVANRGPGFLVQSLTCIALLIGVLYGIAVALIHAS